MYIIVGWLSHAPFLGRVWGGEKVSRVLYLRVCLKGENCFSVGGAFYGTLDLSCHQFVKFDFAGDVHVLSAWVPVAR